MTVIAPALHTVTHMGECPICGGELHSDCDPKRNGWLICSTCGPVYMPLDGRYIRVHIACGLAEAGARAACLALGLLKGGT